MEEVGQTAVLVGVPRLQRLEREPTPREWEKTFPEVGASTMRMSNGVLQSTL